MFSGSLLLSLGISSMLGVAAKTSAVEARAIYSEGG